MKRKNEEPASPFAGHATRSEPSGQLDASRYEALAHELHDSVAQQLGFLSFQARRIEATLNDPAAAAPLVAELRSILARVQKQVRELITGARIGMRSQTLRGARADAVAEFASRSSVMFELDNRLPDACLTSEVAFQVLQIVREALTNVVRHSHARRAWIELACDRDAEVRITVEDDGIGLTTPPSPMCDEHFGLVIMRERAESIGAKLSITSPESGGVRVILLLQSGVLT
jgi:two-component system nitrate/nitrite sensor histidine kinase NarX